MKRCLVILGFVGVLGIAGNKAAFGWGPYCYTWACSPCETYTQDYVPYYVAHPPVNLGWSILRPLERPTYYEVVPVAETAPARPAPPPLRLINPFVAPTAPPPGAKTGLDTPKKTANLPAPK